MSDEAIRWAVLQKPSSAEEKLVLIILGHYSDTDFNCRQPLVILSKKTGLEKGEVKFAIKILKNDGFIDVTLVRGQPSKYKLLKKY